MQTYWLKFTNGSEGHCEGASEFDAVSIAEHLTDKTVAGGDAFKYNQGKNPNVAALPYPAFPMIWQFDHPKHGKTPTFCFGGADCRGKSACPRNYSCTS